MAMSGATRDGEFAMEINTTPLIDVMLVLLTLLILTLPVQTHAIKIDLPGNVDDPPNPPEVVDLRVEFDNSYSWNGTTVSRAVLDTYLRQAGQQVPQPEIHLNADSLAKYEKVAVALGDAQRLGVTKIGFVGIER